MAITYDAGTNKITVTGYSAVTPCTLTDIYNANVAGGWGVVGKLGSYFSLAAYLYFGDGSTPTYFKDTNKFLETITPGSIYLNGTDVYVQFGTLSGDVGVNGCVLLHSSTEIGLFRRVGGYPTLSLYGTMVNTGASNRYIAYNALINLLFVDVLNTSRGPIQATRPMDIVDSTLGSVFVSNPPTRFENIRLVFQLGLAAGSNGAILQNISCPVLYIWQTYPNTTAFYIRNCEFVTETWYIYGSDRGATGYFQSAFDLHVMDGNFDPVEGAVITMVDQFGTQIFSIETDENGDIESQWVTYRTRVKIITPATDTDVTYTPHTVTISASGYATRVVQYTMDRKREEIEMLDDAPATVPDAPSGLTATATSQTQIDLAWTDNSDDEIGFRIERSPNGTTLWTHIATTDAEAESYSDTGLSCGTTYYYRVCAVNDVGNSEYSDVDSAEAEACTIPQVVINLESWIP